MTTWLICKHEAGAALTFFMFDGKTFYLALHFLYVTLFCFIETVVKFLTSDKERVRIGCPHRHVIYHPSVYAGVSGDSSYKRSPTDCTGVPRRLQKHLDKCYLKKSCDIVLQKSDTITCGNEVDNAQRTISYIVFKKMYCVPKGNSI